MAWQCTFTYTSVSYTFSLSPYERTASDGDGGQTAQIVYLVETANAGATLGTGYPVSPLDVINAAIYARTAAISSRPLAKRDQVGALYCQQVQCAPEGRTTDTFKYTATLGGYPRGATPDLDQPTISFYGADQTEDLYVDTAGKKVCNALGEYFETQPQREQGHFGVNITRNETNNPAGNILAYSWTVSSASYQGSVALGARMGRITASKKWEGAVAYWEVTYPILVKVDGTNWRSKPYEVSYRYKASAGDAPALWKQKLDSAGSPVLVNINSDGTLNGDGVTSTPVVANGGQGFKPYVEVANWGPLNLPDITL